MEEMRGAQKEVDFRRHLEGSPPKLDLGQGWGNVEISSIGRPGISNLESLLLHGNTNFENKYWTGKKKGKKESLSAYGTKGKSDFGQT